MRKYLLLLSVACSTAQAHPGHGDTAHYVLGGPHAGDGVQQVLAHPHFAVALLVVSVLMLTVTALVARARSPGRCPGQPRRHS